MSHDDGVVHVTARGITSRPGQSIYCSTKITDQQILTDPAWLTDYMLIPRPDLQHTIR
jgi:hypothetical protein